MQLAITLPKDRAIPLYKQISNALREAILTGRVKPGDKMPSTRELETSLKVARLTVWRAMQDLASQGYVKTILGSGCYVNGELFSPNSDYPALEPDSALETEDESQSAPISLFGERVLSTETFDLERDCKPACDPAQLPLLKWRQMLYQAARLIAPDNQALNADSEPFGYRPLRKAIAEYLLRARSIRCNVNQIVVFSSLDSGTDLLLRLLVNRGETIAVENPGSQSIRNSALINGLQISSTSVDREGLVVEELYDSARPIRLAHVTSSHHFPSGVTLSQKRREQLLTWAHQTGAKIIEDDVDCEYTYGARLLPALAATDTDDCVIYKSSFHNVLFPMVRFGFMVLPRSLVKVVHQAQLLVKDNFSVLEAHAMTDLINEGHFEQHIRRCQTVNSKRRAATIHALTKHLRDYVQIDKHSAGLHLIVRFSEGLDSEAISRSAEASGLPLLRTDQFYLLGSPKGEYILQFAYANELEIAKNIARFAESLTSTYERSDSEASVPFETEKREAEFAFNPTENVNYNTAIFDPQK